MPQLVRLYIQSVALGFLISAGFTAGLLWLDVAGLGRFVLGSDIGWIAALMLVIFNGIVFAAVQFAFRVMGMADKDEGPKRRAWRDGSGKGPGQALGVAGPQQP